MEKECIICGAKFKPRNQCQITCSDKCSAENRRRRDKLRKQGKTKKITVLTCPNCGKEFKQNVVTQVYCSDKCRNAYNKKRDLEEYPAQIESEKKTCSYCGQKFTPTTPTQKYCSKGCCEMAWGRRSVARKLICKNCCKEFSDVYNAKYCSTKCRNEAIKKESAANAMAKASGQAVKSLADWTREASE